MSRKPDILVERNGQRLEPHSHIDAEYIEELGSGVYRIRPVMDRSNKQNRMYWGMLRQFRTKTKLVNRFHDDRAMHSVTLLSQGKHTPAILLGGKGMTLIPDSTAFENMGGDDFRLYFDEAQRMWEAESGVSREKFINPKYWGAAA